MTDLTEMESKTIITAYKIGKEIEWICEHLAINHDKLDIYIYAEKNGTAKIFITFENKKWEKNILKEDRFLSLDDFSKYAISPLIKQIIKETEL